MYPYDMKVLVYMPWLRSSLALEKVIVYVQEEVWISSASYSLVRDFEYQRLLTCPLGLSQGL